MMRKGTFRNADLISRSISFEEGTATLILERLYWEAFDEICRREGLTDAQLGSIIRNNTGGPLLPSSASGYIVQYFKEAIPPDGVGADERDAEGKISERLRDALDTATL